MGSTNRSYPYISGDGVPIAQPLFQEEGDGLTPISPLQLHFAPCSIELACSLNSLWHSRLPHIHTENIRRGGFVHCFTAEFSNRYYATAIWTRPVAANRMKDGYKLIELRRLAIAQNAPVNTATRMLSWMCRTLRKSEPSVIRAISYQDTEVHTGTIYKAAGWSATLLNVNVQPWETHKTKPGKSQSLAPKQRWEIDLR